MIIREMEVDDIDEITKLQNSLFSHQWSKEEILSLSMKPAYRFLLCEEKGKILGFVCVSIVIDEAEIIVIGVRKSCWSTGIGSFLLKSLMILLRDIEVRSIFLEVRESNTRAINLYLRNGFIKEGIRKGYYDNPKEDGIVMVNNRLEKIC